MDVNSGWVTRNQYNWGDVVKVNENPARFHTMLCHNANNCGSFYIWAYAYGARVTTGINAGASTGYDVSTAQ
jgi:hypothetical protein